MLQEIIERLKKDFHGKNGCYGVLESWIEDQRIQQNDYRKGIIYGNINGMLWGLYATGYITNEERKQAIDELINMQYRAAQYCWAAKSSRQLPCKRV